VSLALRAAIAAHPPAWREKNASAVIGTLMDVADERGGRVPLGETLNLALRGLWLRFRGSVSFWGSLVILVLMVASALSHGLYESDGSLTTRLLMVSRGLAPALLVLAVIGGWNGARARVAKLGGTRARMRRLASDSLFPVLVTAAAYLIAFAIVCLRLGAPWVAWPAGLVLAAHLASALAAIAIGDLLGATLPRVVVIFVAPLAVLSLAWWAGPAWGGQVSLAYVIDIGGFVRTYALAGALVAMAFIAALVRSPWLRAVPGIALVAVCTLSVAAIPTTGLGGPPLQERSRAELVCSDARPVVCLWPEQDAAFGESLRGDLSAAYERGIELGLPMDDPAPSSAARYGMTGIPAPEHQGSLDMSDVSTLAPEFGLGVGGLRPEDIVAMYAFSVPFSFGEESQGESEVPALQFAIAILLGVERDKAWPAVADPYTGQPGWDATAIPDEAAARALVDRWLTTGLDGVRSPN
jgi:hypothetical protein